MIRDTFAFSEPFMYLDNDKSEGLLELIQMEDYKNTKAKVDNYLATIKSDSYSEMEK